MPKTFVCHLDRYIYKMLQFIAAPAGDMFQIKIDEIFRKVPKAFSVADDILIVGHEDIASDYDRTLSTVLKIYRKEKLKFNKDKCYFRCTSISHF